MIRNNQRSLERTRRGRLLCKSSENYSRFNIGCGSVCCTECEYLKPLKPTLCRNVYLIPDVDTVLHQIDVLTSPVFLSKFNVILLQSVVAHIKHTNYSFYKRIESELLECNKHNAPIYIFMNTFNQTTNVEKTDNELYVDVQFKQMLKTYQWYKTHLLSATQEARLFIITESAKSLKLLQVLKVDALKLDVLVKHLFPSNVCDLQDSLSFVVKETETETNQKRGGSVEYRAHWSVKRVETELAKKQSGVFRGKYFSIRGFGQSPYGKVIVEGEATEISVYGLSNINRAVHEDVVAVQLSKDGKQGKIVSVLSKNWRAYAGSLQVPREGDHKQSGFIYFIPVDGRIPKIGIVSAQICNLMSKRIIVCIDDWKVHSKYPVGHYCETIGEIGDLDTETQVLLLEHDIPHKPWSDAVLKCLPSPAEIDEDDNINLSAVYDLQTRRNLIDEGYTIFSIDPPGCTDIDDALHCKSLSNGNMEIGVHIADVSYYVQSGSALDEEASKRATSVYLVDRRIDMLPSLLSTKVCSLKAGKVRLSFSVCWEIALDEEKQSYSVVRTSFDRCVIKSCKAFSYQQAQAVIDDKGNQSEIALALRNLLHVSKLLKQQRMEKGALSLSSLQPKFTLKGDGKKPDKLSAYKLYETNSLIEEFMLFANICVATKILAAFPSFAMLRRHPSPSQSMLSTLVKYASVRGFEINTESSKQLSLSLSKCQDANDASLNELMKIITTRCMTQALYFISGSVGNKNDFQHYGLASSIYTHFTSPIRRYADIIVHRQLANCCGFINERNKSDMQYIKNGKLMNTISNTLNRRHRLAQYINRASSNLYTLLYFDHVGATPTQPIVVKQAVISGVDQNCVNVYIQKYCMERRIYLNNKHEWKFDESNLVLHKVTPPAIKYQIFDKVTVKIYVLTSKFHRKKLVVEIDEVEFKNNQQASSDFVAIDQFSEV